jgi:hypothetical protein
MAHQTTERPPVVRPTLTYMRRAGPSGHAFSTLYLGYIALPLIAGADKFYYALTDWTKYLAPIIPDTLGVSDAAFMRGVGIIEMLAALLVAAAPRIGAPVVGAWLLGIIGNLVLRGAYYDVALRDFGLAVGAYALWQMSRRRAHGPG